MMGGKEGNSIVGIIIIVDSGNKIAETKTKMRN